MTETLALNKLLDTTGEFRDSVQKKKLDLILHNC